MHGRDLLDELDEILEGPLSSSSSHPLRALHPRARGELSFDTDFPSSPTPGRTGYSPLPPSISLTQHDSLLFGNTHQTTPAHTITTRSTQPLFLSGGFTLGSSPPTPPRSTPQTTVGRPSDTTAEPGSDYGDESIWEDSAALDQVAAEADQSVNQALREGMPKDPLVDPQLEPISNGPIFDDEPVATPQVLQNREKARLERKNAKGQLEVSVENVEPHFRAAFPFKWFNAVQSKAFQAVYHTTDNLVLSAPTGAGKTTIFELAFLRMLKEWEGYPDKRLAIYIAPTKALCSERWGDWSKRLPLIDPSIQCFQLTGDTTGARISYDMRDASLIVTTPEKWDSVTRRASDSQKLLDRLSLVMIDEVHILCENRGATLEVVVSRMKALGRQVRFVAVSASVPNIDDISQWLAGAPEEKEELGVYEGPVDGAQQQAVSEDAGRPMAKVFKFGEDYRPVPLKKIVKGFEAANAWGIAAQLDKALFPLLLNLHSDPNHRGKPVLVFCPTRKQCQTTAEYMNSMYTKQVLSEGIRPWEQPARGNTALGPKDANIAEWAKNGIAVHHAGLDVGDRHLIEDWFREGRLKMLVSTSTLAVGVNLPAHTVVIKGTITWTGPVTGLKEYSDIELQQMMGRAGRPQYDKYGVVILMCERSKEAKYRDMLNSKTILESRLHEHLTEHINSEIGRKTITSLKSAKEWLRSSFLFVRIQKNPCHYAFATASGQQPAREWEQWLECYVEEALEKLETHELVTHDQGVSEDEDKLRNGLEVTEYGRIMSRWSISYGTMCSILKIDNTYTTRHLLEILCGAVEFVDLRVRPGEAAPLNAFRTNDGVRYKLREPVKTYADKVFLYLQMCFAGLSLDDDKVKMENASPFQTLLAIYQSAPRIANAICAVCCARGYGNATKNALELVHVVQGKAWEDQATVFRQLDSIGPKSIMALQSRGINTFEALRKTPGPQINILLNRAGTFGEQIHSQIDKLPRYSIALKEVELKERPGESPAMVIEVTVQCLSAPEDSRPTTRRKSKWGQFVNKTLTVLLLRSDGQSISLMSMPAHKLSAKSSTFCIDAEFTSPSQTVSAYVGVNEVSGLQTVAHFDPELPSSLFPEPDSEKEEEAPPVQRSEVASRLPNGNYPCSHSCRNKRACNHVCCKEGVKNAPKSGPSKTERNNPRPANEILAEVDARLKAKKGTSKAQTPEQEHSPVIPTKAPVEVQEDEESIDATGLKRPRKSRMELPIPSEGATQPEEFQGVSMDVASSSPPHRAPSNKADSPGPSDRSNEMLAGGEIRPLTLDTPAVQTTGNTQEDTLSPFDWERMMDVDDTIYVTTGSKKRGAEDTGPFKPAKISKTAAPMGESRQNAQTSETPNILSSPVGPNDTSSISSQPAYKPTQAAGNDGSDDTEDDFDSMFHTGDFDIV